MQVEILGMKIRVELLVILVVLGMVLGAHLVGGCSKVGLMEGMSMMGAPLNSNMGEGVKGSYDGVKSPAGKYEWRAHDHDSYVSKMVTPDKAMDFFTETDFKPECCGSTYSATGGVNGNGVTSGGCACLSTEQMDYLNTRGGNRTLTTEF